MSRGCLKSGVFSALLQLPAVSLVQAQKVKTAEMMLTYNYLCFLHKYYLDPFFILRLCACSVSITGVTAAKTH